MPLRWCNQLWQSSEEGAGTEARLGVCRQRRPTETQLSDMNSLNSLDISVSERTMTDPAGMAEKFSYFAAFESTRLA